MKTTISATTTIPTITPIHIGTMPIRTITGPASTWAITGGIRPTPVTARVGTWGSATDPSLSAGEDGLTIHIIGRNTAGVIPTVIGTDIGTDITTVIGMNTVMTTATIPTTATLIPKASTGNGSAEEVLSPVRSWPVHRPVCKHKTAGEYRPTWQLRAGTMSA